jgi:hypothetical protein
MKKVIAIITVAVVLTMGMAACEQSDKPKYVPKSDTGVSKVSAIVTPGANGLTKEQENIKRRVELENKPGSIKHLYVIASMTGDVIIYSTVDGKVTSSGKKLTPKMTDDDYSEAITIGGKTFRVNDILQDDGTYGDSATYIFWWDARDVYHQHWVTGGQILHLSDQPMNFPKIILNLEAVAAK